MHFVMNVASVVFANNFGRKYLGEIQGLADSLGVLGSALGPFPFGLVKNQTGSYNGISRRLIFPTDNSLLGVQVFERQVEDESTGIFGVRKVVAI